MASLREFFKDWTPERVAAFNAKNTRGTPDKYSLTLDQLPKHNSPVPTEGFIDNSKLVIGTQKKEKKPKKVYASELDRLNQTERRFYDLLCLRCADQPERHTIYIQTFTLRLAAGCRYTPDLSVVWSSGRVDYYEVKGKFIWSKAMNKPRMAANKFPQHRFFLAQWKDNQWTETRIMP